MFKCADLRKSVYQYFGKYGHTDFKLIAVLTLIAWHVSALTPVSVFEFERAGYTVSYDGRNKVPLWVLERLTSENLMGNADRAGCAFKEDCLIPLPLRAALSDYKGSGFDRGHLAGPAIIEQV